MPIRNASNDEFVIVEQIIPNEYVDFSVCEHTPSSYMPIDANKWRILVPAPEATDAEIINYLADSEAFAFLKDPEEDVYTLDDGEPA